MAVMANSIELVDFQEYYQLKPALYGYVCYMHGRAIVIPFVLTVIVGKKERH